MGKKKMDIIHVCEVCGFKQEPDREKSNENWVVYSTTCSKCGGKVKMVLGQ